MALIRPLVLYPKLTTVRQVDGTSTYIGVWGDQAEGTVSIEIE